jgi:hypothetical protein
MGSKNNPGKFDCYKAAHPDEPMFVLLGRDQDAPGLVRFWAAWREERGEDAAKVAEARQCADAMKEWRAALKELRAVAEIERLDRTKEILEEIRFERERQKSEEGCSINQDDEQNRGQIAWAAACYAAPETIWRVGSSSPEMIVEDAWPWRPWARELWNRKDRRGDLVRAAALIIAEIERLDRAEDGE